MGTRYFHSRVQNLVNTQAGEGPFYPHQQEDYEECLSEEPYKSRNVIHHCVEAVQADDVQRHPASQEYGGCPRRLR